MINCHLLSLLFSSFLLLVSGLEQEITFTVSPPQHGKFYEVGESMNLTCRVLYEDDLKVYFGRTKAANIISENTDPYHQTAKILRINTEKYTFFVYQIKVLDLEQNGVWSCAYGAMKKKKFITIKVVQINKAGPIKVSLLKFPNKIKEVLPKFVLGKGTRTNPHDLLKGAKINISSISSCGNFKPRHSWSYYNISDPGTVYQLKSIKSITTRCTMGKKDQPGFKTLSWIQVSCDGPPRLTGSSRIMVTTTFKEVKNKEIKSVYVLCPGGHKDENGTDLTNMEIVGICVSVLVTICMMICLTISARRLIRKAHDEKYGEIGNSSHMHAIRV